jgi:glycosyltransferase involved in cell wall biosynthesis
MTAPDSRGSPAPDIRSRVEELRSPDSGTLKTAPFLSLIVPAYQAAEYLEATLPAIADSVLPRHDWELIVVNDGSDEETGSVAERYADRVIRLPGKPRGPSYARNRGSEVATGDVLVFLDADVRVGPDTLSKFAELFRSDPELAAAFGSYDAYPPAAGVASRYRNLLHHYVHQQQPGEAETFWGGCGAIRANVFHDLGGYDEWHFARPQIEDIELGRRLRLQGHRILLRPDIQVTHLKAWAVRDILVTDFFNRGVPWTRLILHEGRGEGSRVLNVRPLYRWSAGLANLANLLFLAALVFWSWPFVAAAALCLLIVIVLHLPFFRLVARCAGAGVTLAAIPLYLFYHMANGFSALAGWLTYNVVGPPQPPPDVAAFEEVGLDTWPPVPSRPKASVWDTGEATHTTEKSRGEE